MHVIVYISDYIGEAAQVSATLASITATSQRRNANLAVTGVLFFQNGTFLQVIEGPESSLRALMARIEQDTRHMNITTLIDQPIDERSFASWNMDSFNLADSVQLEFDELEEISEAFKANPVFRTDLLVQFFKNMV
ncbi:MAG: BLUF domain-containing protein [Gammaproteobacteria bacterium]|nr:BLUF domain-containing protein [Gammaproteobacteria bacterium]